MTAQQLRPCRLSDLVTDPAVHGDLLALGAALVHLLDHGHWPEADTITVKQLARLAFAGELRPYAPYRLRRTVEVDARRYEPPWDSLGTTCEAPMVRRDGACGHPATGTPRYVTDWTTGEQTQVNACSRHRDWQEATERRSLAARPENPPTPCANTGGVLRGHFPELDWAELYRWATDGRWVDPPEREPVRKPTLSVIVGDGEDGNGDRAMLTALPGGTWSSVGVET